MTTTIPKQGQRAEPFHRHVQLFPRARDAFRAFLAAVQPKRRVLLPAYIGWSPREGSGVHDPIGELGLSAVFYRMDASLHLDIADLEAKLAGEPAVVVLIHYFGHVDPSYREAVALARRHGALVVEDSAHAMFSDLLAGSCGRLGDVSLYSLHKMLPVASGGALVTNPGAALRVADGAADASLASPFEFDLHTLAAARRRNTEALATLLAPLAGTVDPLWAIAPDEVWQTFPVRIRRGSRDRLYQTMNEAGFGVVSLYHTLIDGISREEFPGSHELARTVMNLPVHQDATPATLAALVDELGRQVRAHES